MRGLLHFIYKIWQANPSHFMTCKTTLWRGFQMDSAEALLLHHLPGVLRNFQVKSITLILCCCLRDRRLFSERSKPLISWKLSLPCQLIASHVCQLRKTAKPSLQSLWTSAGETREDWFSSSCSLPEDISESSSWKSTGKLLETHPIKAPTRHI